MAKKVPVVVGLHVLAWRTWIARQSSLSGRAGCPSPRHSWAAPTDAQRCQRSASPALTGARRSLAWCRTLDAGRWALGAGRWTLVVFKQLQVEASPIVLIGLWWIQAV